MDTITLTTTTRSSALRRQARGTALAAIVGSLAFLTAPSIAQDANPGSSAPPKPVQAEGEKADAIPEAEVDAEAKKVIAKSIEKAFGDWAKNRSLKSMKATGTMNIPSQGISGDFKLETAAGDKMMMTITIGGFGEMKQGLDGSLAWAYSMMGGAQIMDEAQAKDFSQQSDLYAEVDWAKYYSKASYGGEQTITDAAGQPVETHLVVFTSRATGQETKVYYDRETYLRVRMDSFQSVPGAGQIPATTFMSDYKDIDGMMMSHKLTVTAGPQRQELAFTSVELNPTFEDGTFDPPAEVKEMAKRRPLR